MSFRLDYQRATEAAGVLLRCALHHQMTRLRILKLMYIADRESLKEKGWPITGDRFAALDNGPVLSGVYDIIKNMHANPSPWPDFIESEHINVVLKADPGVGNLSRWEVAKLQEIWTRYEDFDDFEIVHKVVHRFPEYIKNKPQPGSSKPISYRDVMLGAGLTEQDVNRILEDAKAEFDLDVFWYRVSEEQ